MRHISKSNLRRLALLPTMLIFIISGLLVSAGTTRAASSSYCQVTYQVTSQWPGGFGASIGIQNTSSSAWTSWTLAFAFPASGQAVTQGWNGVFSQSGQNITVTNESYNGNVAVNASVSPGFNGSWTTSNPVPTSFSVNGNACNGAATPTPTPTATSTPGTTPTPTVVPTLTPTPTGTPTLTPTPTPPAGGFSQSQIDAAVAAPLLAFAAPTTANSGRVGDSPSSVYKAKAFYFMALVVWYNPAATTSSSASVANRLVASIANVVAGGNEPDANGGLEGWGHNDVAQGLLLARNEPAIWNQLTASQQGKVDLLMQALAIAGNYDFNDANNFQQDLDYSLEGNQCKFNKTDNPNYREGYLNIVIAASLYFGPTALNNFFTSFDYTTFTQQLQAAGFTNILAAWANAQTLLMSGGSDSCGGSGAGVREAFTYNNIPLSNPAGIFDQLATFTYQDTVTSTGCGGAASIADGTTSPYQGQPGMEHEFNSTDGDGCRSDALYAYEGWMNSISSRTTMTLLGDWGCGTTQTHDIQLEAVGSADLLYKLAHGYEGHEEGASRLVNETTPSSDGPSAKGFYFDQQIWTVVLSQVQPC